jgi:prepilin-type N-terminal cleavage/methylation domain-containing protein
VFKRNTSAFTLIELMVVVVIVGILAAVAIPLFQGNITSAKFSEGIAGAGTIRSALRVYKADHGVYPAVATGTAVGSWGIGIAAADLNGKYFNNADYNLVSTASTYTITVSGGGTQTDAAPSGTSITLNQDGTLTKNY